MEAPAVSGSQSYPELCLAAKNKERRQAELLKRQQYTRQSLQSTNTNQFKGRVSHEFLNTKMPGRSSNQRKCYVCGSPNHLANQCDAKKEKSQGPKKPEGNSTNRPIHTGTSQLKKRNMVVGRQDPLLSLMLPWSLLQIWMNVCARIVLTYCIRQNLMMVKFSLLGFQTVVDSGSKAQCVRLLIQDVPAIGIVDAAADITIMGGKLFQKVASVARLKKKNFKPPGITPHTYGTALALEPCCVLTLDSSFTRTLKLRSRKLLYN